MTARAPAPLRLRPAMRLRDARDFASIKAQGRRLANGCLIANWRELPAGSSSKLGVVTGRKLGNAVLRSRARRLLREAFRLHQHDLRSPVAIVLVARASIKETSLASVERDFLAALGRAKLLKTSA
jgi:ribonuclease P protein component